MLGSTISFCSVCCYERVSCRVVSRVRWWYQDEWCDALDDLAVHGLLDDGRQLLVAPHHAHHLRPTLGRDGQRLGGAEDLGAGHGRRRGLERGLHHPRAQLLADGRLDLEHRRLCHLLHDRLHDLVHLDLCAVCGIVHIP
jgi:hypothetical protein